jgi:D-alanyl-D-alanine carboxypeptidase
VSAIAAPPSPRFLLRFIAHDRLEFSPGRRYPYSSTHNFVVALMARAATHRSYYGHTGNTPGYTEFMAATRDGRRSVTASVSGQITNRSTGARLAALKRLRRIEADAVCAALS